MTNSTSDVELPESALVKHTDPSCCIDFDLAGKRNLMCSTELPLCALKIRRFARYLKISCLIYHNSMLYDENGGPSKEDLKKVTDAKVA